MGVGLLVSGKIRDKIGIQSILVLCDCNSFFFSGIIRFQFE